MGKYNSTFYNNERYYDPTVGEAFRNIIREEKHNVDKIINFAIYIDPVTEFARKFTKFYSDNFGIKTNGKPKKFERYDLVKQYISIYTYCMEHADDTDFSVEEVMKEFNLGTTRNVKHVFTGKGDLGKLIRCYKNWLVTHIISWETKSCVVSSKENIDSHTS